MLSYGEYCMESIHAQLLLQECAVYDGVAYRNRATYNAECNHAESSGYVLVVNFAMSVTALNSDDNYQSATQ